MNKDKYKSLASYLDKHSTDQGKEVPSPDAIEEAGFQELVFFWDRCHPAASESESILSKTMQKIKEHGTQTAPIAARRKISARAWRWGVAASFILAATLSLLLLPEREKNDALKMEQYMQANVPADELQEVTLVVADKKQVQIANDSKITYSSTGEVWVNSEKLNETKAPTKKDEKEEYNQIIVPKGRRSMIVLADSSHVWINSGSKVVYPRAFGERKRKIFVEGEVYLQVTRDTTRPFIVNASTLEVEVLGTSFNVTAYKECPEASVVLVEGAVKVKDRREQRMTMRPNERVEVNEEGISKEEVNASDYITWVSGAWTLNGKPLKEVLARLSEYFGQPVYFDPSLQDEPVYGKLFLNDDLEKILESIRQTLCRQRGEERKIDIHVQAY
jgi:ferric-dicitrate binding protein FerR (iron transport regulator)